MADDKPNVNADVELAAEDISVFGELDVSAGGGVGIDAPKTNAEEEGAAPNAGALLVATVVFWPKLKPAEDEADVGVACAEEADVEVDAEAPSENARASESVFCPKPAVGLGSAGDGDPSVKPVFGGIISRNFASVGTLTSLVDVAPKLKAEFVLSSGFCAVAKLLDPPTLNEGVNVGVSADSLADT